MGCINSFFETGRCKVWQTLLQLDTVELEGIFLKMVCGRRRVWQTTVATWHLVGNSAGKWIVAGGEFDKPLWPLDVVGVEDKRKV